MSDLFEGGGWWSTAASWLVSLFGGLGKAEKAAIDGLGLRLVTLGQGVVSAFIKTGKYLKAFADLFRKLWSGIIRPFLVWCLKNIELLKSKLHEWFDPIVRKLLKFRKYILDIYNKWVRPVLDTIDIVRRGLRVLGSLGVDWAKTLDKKLGQIQSSIEEPFQILLSKINEVIGWVDRIIDANGLFHRLTLLTSLFKYKHDLLNFQLNTIVKPLTPEQSAHYKEPMGTWTSEENTQQIVEALRDHDGPVWPKAKEWGQDAARMLRGRGRADERAA